MEEKYAKIESKLNILIVLVVLNLVISVFMVGAINSSDNTSSTDSTTTTTASSTYDVSTFNEIAANDISTFKKDKIYVVYVGRENCSWCQKMLPNLKQAQEDYNYTTQYVDIAKIIDYSSNSIIDQDAYDYMISLESVDGVDNVKDEFGSTPMILIIKNNKVIANQVGYSEYDSLASFLEKAGLKK